MAAVRPGGTGQSHADGEGAVVRSPTSPTTRDDAGAITVQLRPTGENEREQLLDTTVRWLLGRSRTKQAWRRIRAKG
jgi:hypothetical protein